MEVEKGRAGMGILKYFTNPQKLELNMSIKLCAITLRATKGYVKDGLSSTETEGKLIWGCVKG